MFQHLEVQLILGEIKVILMVQYPDKLNNCHTGLHARLFSIEMSTNWFVFLIVKHLTWSSFVYV